MSLTLVYINFVLFSTYIHTYVYLIAHLIAYSCCKEVLRYEEKYLKNYSNKMFITKFLGEYKLSNAY